MMENLHLPLDFLAEETMILGEKLTQEKSNKETEQIDSQDDVVSTFSSEPELSPQEKLAQVKSKMKAFMETEELCDFEEKEAQEDLYPQAAGLIYRICESAGTYIVRSIISENIGQEFNAIQVDYNDKAYSKLRLDDSHDIQELRFFETYNLEQAEVLHEHFSNRRLPKDEDALCNISDPGFSWWLDSSPGKIKVYFKSHGVNCSQTYLKLGPLADLNVFRRRMSQLSVFIEGCDSDVTILENDSSLNISSSISCNVVYEDLKLLILEGKLAEDSILLEMLGDHLTLKLFLKEISLVRTFWLEIEQFLSTRQSIQ